MATTPLMPKATAVWLVENTALSFDQIADFCKLHPLEVKAIADASVDRRNDHRFSIDDESDMAEERLVEDGIDGVSIVIAALRQPVDSRSVGLF